MDAATSYVLALPLCCDALAAWVWGDAAWLTRRADWDWQHAPVNIYELHSGSWMRHPDGKPYLWRELAERVVHFAVAQG